jgi:DNA repair protein RadD
MDALRDYQARAVEGVQAAIRGGSRAVLLQLPTGAGKTASVVLGIIIPSIQYGRMFGFLAHLEELLDDTAGRVRRFGVACATVRAGRVSDPAAPVWVASTQTLAKMLERGEALPPCDRLVIDEAHRSSSRTLRAIIAYYKARGTLILGLSATPARGDDQPLDEFDTMVCGPSVRELIDAGHLVQLVVHAPAKVLTRGVAEDPADVVNLRCVGRRCMVFAPTAADAVSIAARIPGAETILDSTPWEVRRTVRDRLASGETQHLVTVRALLEGFDAPIIDVIILCVAATTIVVYQQAIGRGARPYTCPVTGRMKRDCQVYDLRGAVHLHGLPDDARRWSLEGAQGRSAVERPVALRRCDDCHAIYAPRTVCPACGSVFSTATKLLRVQRNALFEASGVPIGVRFDQWLSGAVRAITTRRPDISVAWARTAVLKKPPTWVRSYLESLHAECPPIEDEHAAA